MRAFSLFLFLLSLACGELESDLSSTVDLNSEAQGLFEASPEIQEGGDCLSLACQVMIALGERSLSNSELPPIALEECPVCGRETGFLDTPLVSIEQPRADVLLLDWEPIEGADYYSIHILGISGEKPLLFRRSEVLHTERSHSDLKLELGVRYVVYVIAWSNSAQKRRSLASSVVEIQP